MGTQDNTSPLSANAATKTEEELAEELRLWVQRHRDVVDVFLDAFCVVDRNNRVVDFNVAFTELCGESYRKILKIGNFCDLLKTELCPDQCPSRQVFVSEKAIRLDELEGSSKAYPQLQLIIGGIPVRSDDGTLLGSLLTVRNVSAESELQKKYYERKEESMIDGLTRLYNKVSTENMLHRMVASVLRDPIPQPLTLLMCDIDHFKKVNDTYGHQAGDYVLSTVAQMLKGESRETDVVGRFGGEEFTVILVKSDLPGAHIFAERFRKRVEATEIIFDGKRIPVTISVGTATFAEKWQPGVSIERCVKELVNRADTALYFSKANGRNQVCQYENLPDNKALVGNSDPVKK